MFMEPSFKCQLPTFWVVQRLRLHDSTAEGVGSIPGWETTCPIFWPKEKKKRQLWPELCKVPNHEALCQYKKQKTTPSGFQNQSPNVEITRMTISFCIFWSQMWGTSHKSRLWDVQATAWYRTISSVSLVWKGGQPQHRTSNRSSLRKLLMRVAILSPSMRWNWPSASW